MTFTVTVLLNAMKSMQVVIAVVSFQVNEWSHKIRKEMRVIDRQIRGKTQSASDRKYNHFGFKAR